LSLASLPIIISCLGALGQRCKETFRYETETEMRRDETRRDETETEMRRDEMRRDEMRRDEMRRDRYIGFSFTDEIEAKTLSYFPETLDIGS